MIHDDSIYELDRKQMLMEASAGVASYRKTLLKFCKVDAIQYKALF